jgi:hypothetical protein
VFLFLADSAPLVSLPLQILSLQSVPLASVSELGFSPDYRNHMIKSVGPDCT